MPNCYLIAVCQSSSLDQYSNNWSLFTLTEQVQVHFPVRLPFEAHTFWTFSPDEYERPIDVQLVLLYPDGTEAASQTLALRVITPRQRVRITGLPEIRAVGEYRIGVQWRWQGTENWTRCAVFWGLSVSELPARDTSGA